MEYHKKIMNRANEIEDVLNKKRLTNNNSNAKRLNIINPKSDIGNYGGDVPKNASTAVKVRASLERQ